ncbi:MAG: N-acetylmuramic acid 6-phosphate etherase [Bacteroidia bacterium]|nr:N-acetylmuramic acid 6-phosphate etherase [Bacteroidia bacterium]
MNKPSARINKDDRTTEASSKYNNLEKMSTTQLLTAINKEDTSVPIVVKKQLANIKKLIEAAYSKMKDGGRLFYIGAGTSGRLGIVDASECPPTFGVPFDLVIGIIAGGDTAIRKAVEFAEDDEKQGWKDLQQFKITRKDVLIGIAASGSTPYVIGAVKEANKKGIITGCIVCNKKSRLAEAAQYPIEVVVGPEFVTGSTRMKSGTAQKLVLNMISTSLMIKLGKVKGNKMVEMTPTNNKLVKRGARMIAEELHVSVKKGEELLNKYGNVRKAVANYKAHQ